MASNSIYIRSKSFLKCISNRQLLFMKIRRKKAINSSTQITTVCVIKLNINVEINAPAPRFARKQRRHCRGNVENGSFNSKKMCKSILMKRNKSFIYIALLRFIFYILSIPVSSPESIYFIALCKIFRNYSVCVFFICVVANDVFIQQLTVWWLHGEKERAKNLLFYIVLLFIIWNYRKKNWRKTLSLINN